MGWFPYEKEPKPFNVAKEKKSEKQESQMKKAKFRYKLKLDKESVADHKALKMEELKADVATDMSSEHDLLKERGKKNQKGKSQVAKKQHENTKGELPHGKKPKPFKVAKEKKSERQELLQMKKAKSRYKLKLNKRVMKSTRRELEKELLQEEVLQLEDLPSYKLLSG